MSLATRLLGANPGVQVSSALSGSLTTPSAKGAFRVPGDFEYIDSRDITSNTSTINFTSIPSTYSTLWIVGNPTFTASTNLIWTYNRSTSSYYYLYMENATAGNSSASYNTGNSFGTEGGSVIIKIPDYANTSKNKASTSQGGSNVYLSTFCNNWANTAAISSISFSGTGGSQFVSGTNLTLYGLK